MRYKMSALFAGLALAFTVSACGVDSAPASTETAESADLGGTTQRFYCNGQEPGLPVPLEKEDQFDACMKSYVAQHPDMPWNAKGNCCPLVTTSPTMPTGCGQCFLQ